MPVHRDSRSLLVSSRPANVVRLAQILLIGFVAFGGPTHAGEPDEDALLNRIVGEWRTRTERAKTVSVTWKESVASADGRTKREPETRYLWLELGPGSEVRFENRKVGERTPPGEERGQVFSSFNGRRNFQFTSADNAKDWPRGIVWDATVYDDQPSMQLRTWLLHFRPFAKPAPDLDRTKLEVASTKEVIEGRDCVLLQWWDQDVPFSGRYWVDVERGCSIVRYAEVFRGRATAHMNIRHEERDKLGWIPVKWDAAFANGRMAITGELISVTLNPELQDSWFELAYPEGTVLFDRDTGRRHRMLSDGRKGEVVP